MSLRPVPVLVLSFLVGCGAAEVPAETTPLATRPLELPDPSTNGSRSAEDPRALDGGLAFGEVVARLRTVTAGDEEPRACLVEAGPRARVAAEIAPASQPVPDPPADLDAVLGASIDPVGVLTRWGAFGGGPVSILSLTSFEPPATDAMVIVLLTDVGAYVRRATSSIDAEHAGPFAVSAVADHVTAIRARDDVPVLITAEAAVRIDTVLALLRALPADLRPVVLAVSLPPGTEAPAMLPDRRRPGDRCSEGLPPLRARSGEIEGTALIEAFAPLRPAAERCLLAATNEAARGVRVELAVRIGADGSVQEACITRSDRDAPPLESCVLDAVRALRFPAPSPTGFVDVALPLALVPVRGADPVAICP